MRTLIRLTSLLVLGAMVGPLAPAQSVSTAAAAPVTLILAGSTFDPEAALDALAPLVKAGTRRVAVPIPDDHDPGQVAFRPDGDPDTLAGDRAAAYRFQARRVVRGIRRDGDGAGRFERVIALYDGAETALQLLRSRLLVPRHLILVDPDVDRLEALKPRPERSEPAARKRPRLNIDVFFTRSSAEGPDAQWSELKSTLAERWRATVRVFAADLRGRSLAVIAQEMVWPLRGLRAVRVRPNRLEEISVEGLFKNLGNVDVVFAGEKHDNTVFHRFQLDLLEAMDRGSGDLLLSLEMFERDVQPVLDRFLRDEIPESEFLAGSRPWPNYRSDYRPLIEYAKQHRIPVLAANVPRRYAREVARNGMEALETLDEEERGYVASEALAASPAYRKRFASVMPNMEGDRLDRMFKAQCLKDDTMAESIHEYLEAHPEIRRVVHMNGSFHSSFSLGTVHGLKARRPKLEIAVVTCWPVSNPRVVDLLVAEPQDDYLVYTANPLPRPRRGPLRHPGVKRAGKPMPKKAAGPPPGSKHPKMPEGKAPPTPISERSGDT